MLVIYDFGEDRCVATSPPVRRALLRALQDLLDTDQEGVAKHLGYNVVSLRQWAAEARPMPRLYAEKAAEILQLPVAMINSKERRTSHGST